MQRALRALGAASPAVVARALLALLDAPPICMYIYIHIDIIIYTYIHILLAAGREGVARAPPDIYESLMH